ncbi:MAG: hypothetical protein PHS41_12735, partial [Victivallaceae bacterium]|nr:hypothetical protein [Victivallaceae bacterium]
MFGWLKSAASCVWSGVKTVVKTVASAVVETGKKVYSAVTGMIKTLTGEKEAEEAKARYQRLCQKAQKAQADYQSKAEAKCREIEASMERINAFRVTLNED